MNLNMNLKYFNNYHYYSCQFNNSLSLNQCLTFHKSNSMQIMGSLLFKLSLTNGVDFSIWLNTTVGYVNNKLAVNKLQTYVMNKFPVTASTV